MAKLSEDVLQLISSLLEIKIIREENEKLKEKKLKGTFI